MTPTTEQLKDLLAKVTPGEWRMGHRWQSIIADGETGHDDDDSIKAYGGHLVCESVAMPANATLIALAPTLAAEVVRLRGALTRRVIQDIERLVDWLDEDEGNAELLLASLTPEQISAARQVLDATIAT